MNEVSVIVPACNAGRWLDAALASLVAQGDAVGEILVVDDASADDTAAVAAAWAARDGRVRLLGNAQRLGPAGARNRALAAAACEWIVFLDADDVAAPGRVERLLAVARATGADAVADNMRYFRDGTSATMRTLLPVRSLPVDGARIDTQAYLRRSAPGRTDGLGILKPLVRREFLLRHRIAFREAVRTSEDYFFNLELLLAGAYLQVIPDPLYGYRIHAGSTTVQARGIERLDAQQAAFRELAARCEVYGDSDIAAELRRCDAWLGEVQKPLLQLRARFLQGERAAVLLYLLRKPVLWWPLAIRAGAWLRRRLPGASAR